MSDRDAFRASVIASLMDVECLTRANALHALDDHGDPYNSGLPAEDVARTIAAEWRRGDRSYAPR